MAAREKTKRKKKGIVKVDGKPLSRLEIRELALPHAALALSTLARICKKGDTDSSRVSAANSLLDRAYGKPTQSHRLGGMPGEPIRVVSTTMTPKEASDAYQATLSSGKNDT